MGAFFKSFWGQMGRSTGKRVSNAIFGDKWATPYRVAVDKPKGKRSRSYREGSYGKQARYSGRNSSPKRVSTKSRSGKWLYWLAGFILFSGTYNAILHPTKDDVVLVVMLWVVAIIYISYKYLRTR